MNSDFVALQAQIRVAAEEQSAALSSLSNWTKTETRRKQHSTAGASSTSGVGKSSTGAGYAYYNPSASPEPRPSEKKAPASHVYDKGYNKWQSFDVDTALQELETDDAPGTKPTAPTVVGVRNSQTVSVSAGIAANRSNVSESNASREDGNKLYRNGDFKGAIHCFTRAIQLDGSSALAYSNRALAYIQLREYRLAIDDATQALQLDPTHVKSWLRRATARSNMGLHASACRDAAVALALEPSNKDAIAEVRKERESVKACAKRAPLIQLPVRQCGPMEALHWVTPQFLDAVMDPVQLDDMVDKPKSAPVPSASGKAISSRPQASAPEPDKPKSHSAVSTMQANPVDAVPPAFAQHDARPPHTAATTATFPSEDKEQLIQRSSSAAAQVPSPVKLITSSYEFEKRWRTAGSNSELKASILLKEVATPSWPSLFRTAMDAEIFMDVITVLQWALSQAKDGGTSTPFPAQNILACINSISSQRQMHLTTSMLLPADRAAVKTLLDGLKTALGESERTASIDPLYARLGLA